MYSIWMPVVLDSGVNDTFTMVFDPKLPFMKYNRATHSIDFDLYAMAKRDIKSYDIMIRLTDNKDAETKYK